MENNYLDDSQIKQELLTLLQSVTEYLDRYNIKYTIIAGTLLGAVRHKGFIPWDDDIDLGVLRPDYNKLIEIIKTNQDREKNFEFVGSELDNETWPYLKYINKNINIIEGNSVLVKKLWIDIFPLDAIPDKGADAYFFILHKIFRRFYSIKAEMDNEEIYTRHGIKAVILRPFMTLLKKMDLQKISKKYAKMCSAYNVKNNRRIGGNTVGIGLAEAFPKEYMDETVNYEFEGIKVKGMKRATDWLQIRYDDFMKLPPESERKGHRVKAWYEVDSK